MITRTGGEPGPRSTGLGLNAGACDPTAPFSRHPGAVYTVHKHCQGADRKYAAAGKVCSLFHLCLLGVQDQRPVGQAEDPSWLITLT